MSRSQVCFTSKHELFVKRVDAGGKQVKWTAHEGVVTCVDWNSVNDLIISGGEDCLYKVWDSFGRQLYSSNPFSYVITSVAWQPKKQGRTEYVLKHLSVHQP